MPFLDFRRNYLIPDDTTFQAPPELVLHDFAINVYVTLSAIKYLNKI